ncbi:hypothetical protein ScPMuIL_004552 [Solemya velum]
MSRLLGALAVVVCSLVAFVTGHGRLVEPPSRSSMWRYGYDNPPNYDDNQLFCGGFQVQWTQNYGKCGVCGDPWQGPWENEPGGKYANGIMVRRYEPGEVINVTIELTANHHGWMEFRLCANDNPNRRVRQECFDQNILRIVGTSDSRVYAPKNGQYHLISTELILPERVRCRACVLQWRYNAGNSWGVDPITKHGCIGCGPQEQFYGCADIVIGHYDVPIQIPEKVPSVVDVPKEVPSWQPPDYPPIQIPERAPSVVDVSEDVPDWQRTDHPPAIWTVPPVAKDEYKPKDFDDGPMTFKIHEIFKMKELVDVFGNEILQHEFAEFLSSSKFERLISNRQSEDVCECQCKVSAAAIGYHVHILLLIVSLVFYKWWTSET